MRLDRTWQVAAGSAVAGLALAAGAVVAAGPWDSGQRKAERDWAAAREPAGGADHGRRAPGGRPAGPPRAPGVLAALAAGTGAGGVRPAAGGALGRALAPLMADPALGALRSGCILDVATGTPLFAADADRPMTPASTVKIATALAVLSARGPDHRIETRVLADPGAGRITLVGAGDPTLTAGTPVGAGRPYEEPAGRAGPAARGGVPTGGSLVELADETAAALKAAGKAAVTLGYDASLYSGTAVHPIGPGNDNIAPVTALMTDEGRRDGSYSGTATRSEDPAGDTARSFAALLGKRGIKVAPEVSAGRPAPKAAPVAATSSAPLGLLVERMLTESDNDLAEALARQTALAERPTADFGTAERAVTGRLKALGVDLRGARFADGSGLSRDDKVSARLLAALLARAADPARPDLRPVLTGLPVAGFSGTLKARNTGGSPAAGLLRAKTGTLNGVNALAGTVVDPSGRLLAFAFLAEGTASKDAAQGALDRLGVAVAGG
ncbi:D-alanyl-D-alanine carboxypeptidase/D-alanyl-D-alanine-endopeptidase [Streptomyces sp. NPDC089919]|uniref:D-alanyl-D-alanine carboxypeptidase/D-alanyl-D-alanine endopeptidase n=1 Tax=Streptomyces sp. NPDC089919 TaxID=3155188 RepID=UPI003425B276